MGRFYLSSFNIIITSEANLKACFLMVALTHFQLCVCVCVCVCVRERESQEGTGLSAEPDLGLDPRNCESKT